MVGENEGNIDGMFIGFEVGFKDGEDVSRVVGFDVGSMVPSHEPKIFQPSIQKYPVPGSNP